MTIPLYLMICLLMMLACTAMADNVRQDILTPAPAGSVRMQGWIGDKLSLCIRNRVMAQDIQRLVTPFRDKSDGGGGFRCEFWGKWFTSAALAYSYQPTPAHRAKLDEAVRELLATQSADGYIGTYAPGQHLGSWDVWGRKYVLLGLIAYYDQTGDKSALQAACREADYLIGEIHNGKINLADTSLDVLKGLPSSSVLEPIVMLHQRTGDRKYLDFANYITDSWSKPMKYAPKGMRLIEDALANVPPIEIDSPKAYEMMSCFEGVCELYRSTGEERYLDAARNFANAIRKRELMVDGSASNQELWCDGARAQTEILEQPQETCVTVTWMKLCYQMLRLTGDPKWADELEISLYNALAGAMTPNGDWWAYFTPLIGERVPSWMQYSDAGLSCCVANGPRGLLLTPKWAVMSAKEGPVVNLYAPVQAMVKLEDGTEVTLVQDTDYPEGGQVNLSVNPEKTAHFTLSLRIPAWSKVTGLDVNGRIIACKPGTYARITREWKKGDTVKLSLDMRARAISAQSGAPDMAVMRGPILLALDNRFVTPQDIDVRLATNSQGYVDIIPVSAKPAGVWMAFEVPFKVRPSHFYDHYETHLTMCDFASAGNEWSEGNLYRVWLPQPLFLEHAFAANTWKLIVPTRGANRPEIPRN